MVLFTQKSVTHSVMALMSSPCGSQTIQSVASKHPERVSPPTLWPQRPWLHGYGLIRFILGSQDICTPHSPFHHRLPLDDEFVGGGKKDQIMIGLAKSRLCIGAVCISDIFIKQINFVIKMTGLKNSKISTKLVINRPTAASCHHEWAYSRTSIWQMSIFTLSHHFVLTLSACE